MEVKQLNVELNWTHVGQYHAYGDTYRECEIHTPDILEDNEVLLLVQEKHKLPKEEWKVKSQNDIMVYFRGWYTIDKTDYGYKYIGCEPYDD